MNINQAHKFATHYLGDNGKAVLVGRPPGPNQGTPCGLRVRANNIRSWADADVHWRQKRIIERHLGHGLLDALWQHMGVSRICIKDEKPPMLEDDLNNGITIWFD